MGRPLYAVLVRENGIEVDRDGYVRIDGFCLGRRVVEDGRVYLEVKDRRNYANQQRGTAYMRVRIEDLLRILDCV